MKKFIPFGRVQEYLATLTEEQRQRTAIKSGPRLGDNDLVQTFKNRPFMVKMIRKEQKSGSSKWHAVVKLGITEGY